MVRSDGAGSKDELRMPFVERRTYRRRRLMDIARLAPLIGALLFLLPLLWPQQDLYPAPDVPSGSSMSSAMVYIFGVWIGLILFCVGFSVVVRLWAVHWTGVGRPAQAVDVLTELRPQEGQPDPPKGDGPDGPDPEGEA